MTLLLWAAALLNVAAGQVWHNHPELDWRTFETEHFLIHFHETTERSAREAATVAEKIYAPVTALYNFEPGEKTHIIIKDVNDEANGLAYFYDNKIEIWSLPLDYDLRGSHRWIQDVLTHEFTHIVQMGTAMKFKRRVPGIYLQLLNYEDERREDVLYGYPNAIVSYPYPGANVPPWFAEGVAQYMYASANYDYWDSHRDMLLRDRVRHHNLLSFAAMNSFGKRGIGNESAYNQGFSFVRYIAARFGEESLQAISRGMAAPWAVSVSRVIKKVTGSSGVELYRDWKVELQASYAAQMRSVEGHPVQGEIVVSQGVANLHPVWRPGKRQFAYLSSRGADYFGQTALYLHDLATGKSRKLSAQARSAPTWSGDGQTLYYAAKSKPDANGSRWNDLYAYDLEADKERRLTHGARATSPVLLDTGRVAYLTVSDGTSNVMVLDLESSEATPLTALDDGTFLHSIAYSSGDTTLICDATLNHGRELLEINLRTGAMRPVPPATGLGGGQRDPHRLSAAGGSRELLLSVDASGIFNLYRLGGASPGYVTNVEGGAFMPSVSETGEIIYSLYSGGGYKIALLSESPSIDLQLVGYDPGHWQSRPTSPRESPDYALQAEPYREEMSQLFVLPRIMLDYGIWKPGFFAYANEVLGRMNLIGGASINALGDTDTFLLTEFSKLRPTLYAEIYTAQRNITQNSRYYDYEVDSDLRFNLMEIVIGARQSLRGQKLWFEVIHSRYRVKFAQKVAGIDAGSVSYPYFIGTALAARWHFSTRRPEYGGNMFPTRGAALSLSVRAEQNNLVDSLAISEFATIIEITKPHNTLRVEFEAQQFLPIVPRRKIGLAYQGKLGWLSNPDVDDFFYFFGGGPPGLKGYTYYDSTAQGTNFMLHTLTLRLPLFIEQHFTVGQLTLQNASVGAVWQVGDGFNGTWWRRRFKQSAGIEFRLSGYNFYVFPFALTYELHRPIYENGSWRHMMSWLFDF